MTILLGPCRCQGCGEVVVWLFDRRHLGWLHDDGRLWCKVMPPKPDRHPRADYWRDWKRRSRAAARARMA